MTLTLVEYSAETRLMSRGNHQCRSNVSHEKDEINRHVSLPCKHSVRHGLLSLRHLLVFPVSYPHLQVNISMSVLYEVLGRHQSIRIKVSMNNA
jgi:hypothetical protein